MDLYAHVTRASERLHLTVRIYIMFMTPLVSEGNGKENTFTGEWRSGRHMSVHGFEKNGGAAKGNITPIGGPGAWCSVI